MDIPFLILAIAGGLLLSRRRALLAAAALWAIAVALVGWGPAKNDGVHTGSLGFWVPWAIVLAIGIGLVMLTTFLRERHRAAPRGRPQDTR
jgi:hypothetical protein